MTKIHLIYVPMTGVGIKQYRGDAWFADRISIFKNYTLKSLLNQTNKDFVLWLSFREEEKNNPLILNIENLIKDSGLKYIFTFNGLMYWDDKNEIVNLSLKERLAESLNKIYNYIGTSEYIYMTRLDSDDMLHRNAVQLIQDQNAQRYI